MTWRYTFGDVHMRHFRTLVAAAAVATAALTASPPASRAGDYDGNFMVRLQGTFLDTVDHTKSITATGAPGANLVDAGYGARSSNSVLPTATLTYFFNKSISAELFCCFGATKIDLLKDGSRVGQVADTWMFPPIVTLQYHFTDMGAFKPYVGAGVQWIHYFGSKTGDNTLAADSVRLSDSFGPALQAGFDYKLGGGWYFNADVKKSWLDTKVSFANAKTLGLGNTEVKHSVDPLTFSLGVGYRFNLF